MSAKTKSLEERLAAHPELKQQLLTLLELAESNIDSADRVEELTVEGIKTFGQQVMQDWAELGLASAILPWSKITKENRAGARALMLDEKTQAEIAFELIATAGNNHAQPVSSFYRHCRQMVAPLIEGLHIPDERFAR